MNKRLIPLLLPFILLILNELVLFYPKLIFVFVVFGMLLILLSVKLLAEGLKNKSWLFFSILPILLYFSFSLYAALLFNPLAIQAVRFLSAALIFYYFKNLYYYLISEDESRLIKLDSFSATVGFLIMFASFSSIYILPLFVRLKLDIMLLIVLPLTCFLFLQPFIFSYLKIKNNLPIIFTNTLIMVQMSWLFSLLPLNSNVLGLLSALTYYLLLIVTRLSLKGSLNRHNLKWPLILVIVALFALLLSARWL